MGVSLLPTAYDRVLATRYGVKAVELIKEGKFGRMVALKGNEIIDIPLERGTRELKLVDMDIYNEAEIYFEYYQSGALPLVMRSTPTSPHFQDAAKTQDYW